MNPGKNRLEISNGSYGMEDSKGNKEMESIDFTVWYPKLLVAS